MRLTCILIVVHILGVRSACFAQTGRLSLNLKNSTLVEVLDQIENQSGYYFFYNNDDVRKITNLSIKVDNARIEDVLKNLLSETGLTYKITDRFIVVKKSGDIDNVQRGQQQKTISGKITDSSDFPLPGVTVVIKGSSRGTIADAFGNYTLPRVADEAILVFSFVGMKTQEIIVGDRTSIDVIMEEETLGIEEVVAIGYGIIKKSDLTGSISSISSADFKLQPIMNPTDAIMGRLSGIMVTNTSGNVEGAVKVRIRGANSINGGNDPLYVCDGVVGTGMPPVDEIESIEVLKDASATAIYGSRGANGVILITTKKGKEGVTHLKINGLGSFLQPVNLYEKLNAYEYALEINALINNVYSESQLNEFKQNGGTDWQREVLKNAWRQKYNVAADGGSSRIKYHIFGEYSNSSALIEGQRSEGYTVRSYFDIDLFKKVQMEWHVDGSYRQSCNSAGTLYEGGTGSLIFNALTWGPTERIYESDGSYNLADQFGAMGDNPVQMMKEKNSWAKSFTISSNSALTWQASPELSFQYRLNISLNNGNNYEWESADYTQSYASSIGTKSFSASIFQNLILGWSKRLGNHYLSGTAVVESTSYSGDSLYGKGSYFGNDNLEYWGMSTATTKESGTSWTNWALLSGVSRISYNYGGKYYLTGTFRADGSSKFAKGNKWSYFPSGSIAWRASEEDFIKNMNVFSNMKLRGSYGKTGNQGVSSYSTIAALKKVGTYYTYKSRVQGYTGKTVNKDLQWEETAQTDIGIDAGFLNDRLNVTMDYYRKDTKKLLLSVTTPYFLGGDDIYVNKGKVRNEGFEFSVNAVPVRRKNMNWKFQANFSVNKNKIVDLGGQTIYGLNSSGNNDAVLSDETYILKEGLPLGELYGYKWLGIWQEDEIAKAAKFGNKPGDNKYEDLTPDGKIDASDRTNIGNGNPDFTWGVNSTFTHGNWDLNIVLQGIHGADKLNVLYAMSSSLHSKSRTITLREAWENYWTPSNKSNSFPNIFSETSTNYINSTQWLQNANFIRLRNISIGYTFNKRIIHPGNIRIFASAQNLLTITGYKGYDPESTSTLTSDVGTGIDSGITPSARTLTIGAQLSF
jgi:TonB-linked SusC/RagA family outer membrane protein